MFQADLGSNTSNYQNNLSSNFAMTLLIQWYVVLPKKGRSCISCVYI